MESIEGGFLVKIERGVKGNDICSKVVEDGCRDGRLRNYNFDFIFLEKGLGIFEWFWIDFKLMIRGRI